MSFVLKAVAVVEVAADDSPATETLKFRVKQQPRVFPHVAKTVQVLPLLTSSPLVYY